MMPMRRISRSEAYRRPPPGAEAGGRDVEQASGLTFGPFAATVIAGRGGDGGVAGEVGDHGDTTAGIEGIADEAAAKIVG